MRIRPIQNYKVHRCTFHAWCKLIVHGDQLTSLHLIKSYANNNKLIWQPIKYLYIESPGSVCIDWNEDSVYNMVTSFKEMI